MKQKILVIDDDEPLRSSLCELLAEQGFDVKSAENGSVALQMVARDPEKPRLIVLDLMMPVMNGWQFRAAQLKDPRVASIPVIAMTASRDLEEIDADEVIYKPLKLDRLLAAIRKHLPEAPAQKQTAPRAQPPRAPLSEVARALFSGGGELGRRMAAIDWPATELGPVEQWSQSLRTCVRIILTSRQPMFVWWGPSLINLYNDAYKSIIGGKHPEALGQPASIVWREIWSDVGPRAERAMRANEGTYDEALLLIMERHGYPEETYYTFSYSPVPDDEGNTGGIICANTDDTQRIIGERQLALLRELAGRTADARTLSEVCTKSASALSTNDRDLPFSLIYVLSNDRRTFLLEGASGIQPQDPSLWPLDEALQRHQTVLVEDLGQRFGALPGGAWKIPPKKAALVPILASGDSGRPGVLVVGLNPFRVFDQSYRGFLELVAGQISASISIAEAYEAEKKRAEALAEIDRAKTTFFSNVSHEFRTPLTLMLGPTQDLLFGLHGSLTPAQREQLEVLHRNGLRLQKLVNALLDFSRIEAGRVKARYEPVDLATVTRELASAFESAVERAGLQLVIDCPPLDEPIFVDRDMWEKIVLNLLSNAFKFTFEGSITVSLRSLEGRVALSVRDTGVGIAEHDLRRVFERFHRIEGMRARTHEGSGIGLALVQELARLHGGAVSVESTLGEGTTFTVVIPKGSSHLPADRLTGATEDAVSPSAAAPFVEEALRWMPGAELPRLQDPDEVREEDWARSNVTPGRVLLADDNADMRSYVTRHLERHWTVIAVEDGGKALERALQDPPDLVLTDVMMPGMDGFELLRRLRAEERTKHIPVIMLSARSGEEAKVEGLQAGAEDYLTKPFSARELQARVNTHLELARLRRESAAERERLYSFFMQTPVPICVLRGTDLVFEMANPLYEQVAGVKDLPGKPLAEAIPETVEQGFDDLLRGVMSSGKPFVGQEMLLQLDRDHDGVLEDAFFTFIYAPIFNDRGVADRVMAVVSEVTDQVVARRVVEESEEKFRRLVGQVQAGIAQLDLTGRFALVNDRFREIVGRAEAELQQRHFFELAHPEDRPLLEKSFAKLAANGAPFALEARFIKPDGSIVWVQSNLARIDTQKSRPQSAAAVVIDITHRKYAERALIERERALAASEAKYRQIFEGVEVSVWEEDFTAVKTFVDTLKAQYGARLGDHLAASPELIDHAIGLVRLRDVNPATLRLLGASNKDQLLASLHLIFLPETRAVFLQELLAIAEGKRVLTADTGMRSLDGTRRDVAITVSFPSGELDWDRVIVTLTDISAQKLMAREREARVAEMERAVRFSEMFVGILGHDLRTPLGAIAMGAHVIESSTDSGKVGKPLSLIRRSAQRMERMISQLLDFTRVRLGGGLPIAPAKVDLSEVTKAIIEEVESSGKYSLALEVAGDPVGIWDRDRLAQLISNLAANACQHGTPGVPVSLRIEGSDPQTVALSVANSGTIPAAILPVIFEPLRRDPTNQRHEGSSGLGLGLYISQQIVIAHGGTIDVDSGPEKGTQIVVRLPRQARLQSPAAPAGR